MVITFLAAFLLIAAGYVAWWAVAYAAFYWLPVAVFAAVGAAGLFLRKRWAQYFWHLFAGVAMAAWLVKTAEVAVSGWPHEDLLSSVVSLIPGLLLIIVCAGGSIAVARHFRGSANAL